MHLYTPYPIRCVILGAIGLLLFLFSVWQISTASRGLILRSGTTNGIPFTVYMPDKTSVAVPRPVVLIGHGFAGSGVMMSGYALTVAHAGYIAVTWDFAGHGANPAAWNSEQLIEAPSQVVTYLGENFPDVDLSRVVVMGHSMGSGVALSFGVSQPDTAATIAISPVPRQVTPELPRNLLLMAGALEGTFIQNAEQLLIQAGGESADVQHGIARKMVIIPYVEHISIVFSPQAHEQTRMWLDLVLGIQPGATDYRDLRMLWYGLAALGALIASVALAPLVRNNADITITPGRIRWFLAIIAGAVSSSLILRLLGFAGVELHYLLGLLVGGYLILWFAVAGLLCWLAANARPDLPKVRSVLGGLIAFATLWIGIGLVGHFVWLNWLLIPSRLVLWPLASLFLLPWFLAVGRAQDGASFWGRLLGWLVHTLILIAALFLAMTLNSQLNFLLLILPVFPLVLGLIEIAAAPQRDSWSYAICGALFVGWMLLAVFPIQ